MTYYVGIDIGGTFTDAVVMDGEGIAMLLKTPTTLDDPSVGVNNALALAEKELGLEENSILAKVDYFGLGTTVATNTLIERKGVRTGIITTRGFRDTILIQRGMGHWAGKELHEMMRYSDRAQNDPIVPRSLIEEVTERVDYKGSVVTPLDEDDVRRAVQSLLDKDVKAIALCLLWSFREPSHEKRVVAIIREMAPDMYLTASSDLAPVLGEYERTATTAMNAYLGPTVQNYMTSLNGSLQKRGLKGALRILDSGGGVMTPEQCGKTAVAILTSGPTGGVLASAQLARRIKTPNVITADMGGTSFDVGMIIDYEPAVVSQIEINGYHVLKPAVQVTAIGAGGGSIATVSGGRLFVGPGSAGSTPGPVCYGRGGTEPTVTDADLVLGIYDPDYFLGGTFKLDKDAAERAISEKIAKPLGLTLQEAAAGINAIADHRMANLLETLTVGQGHDPRDFVIFAYGGAGGSHCHRFGSELGVQSIIVPSTATVHSAFGAVTSDLHLSAELSDPMQAFSWENITEAFDPARLTNNFLTLEHRAKTEMMDSGARADGISIQRFADVRFRMQTNGLSIAVEPGELDTRAIARMMERFIEKFTELYGRESIFRGAGAELASVRIQAKGVMDKPRVSKVTNVLAGGGRLPSSRKIHLGGKEGEVIADVVRGTSLNPGDRVQGPAVIEHPGTTIFVGPGQVALIDEFENTVIKTKQGGA